MDTQVGAGIRGRLVDAFAWRTDRAEWGSIADVSGWWRDPGLLADLGPAIAGLCDGRPTVVLGPQSRGALLGALVAAHLGVGLVEARKEPGPASDSDRWLTRTTPPDYSDEHKTFGFRRDLIRSGDRVVLVDDWFDTGSSALACKGLVEASGAQWVGAVGIVDALTSSQRRRDLPLRTLLRRRELDASR